MSSTTRGFLFHAPSQQGYGLRGYLPLCIASATTSNVFLSNQGRRQEYGNQQTQQCTRHHLRNLRGLTIRLRTGGYQPMSQGPSGISDHLPRHQCRAGVRSGDGVAMSRRSSSCSARKNSSSSGRATLAVTRYLRIVCKVWRVIGPTKIPVT